MDQLKKLLDAAKVHIEFSEMYIRFLQSPGSKNPSPWYTLKQGSYLMGNAYTLVKRYKEYMPGAIDDEDIQVINATLVKLEFDPKHITAGYTDEAYGGLAECFVSKGQGTMYYKLLHSESMDDIRFFLEMVESDIDAPARRFIEKVNHKLQPVYFEKLSKAIDNDNLSEVENCIKKGAVINSINAKGTTPLHIAAKNGSLDIVKFLLKHGAIYCTKNKEGTTPRNFSKNQSICNLLELTEELFEDTKKGNIKVIRKLRSMKPDEIVAVANARDDQGCTLLQVAIINRHKRIASELVEILKNPDKLQSFSSHECNMDQLKKLLDAAKVHIEFSEMYIRFLQSPGSKNPSPWYTLKQGSYLMGNAYTLVKRYKEYMPGAIDDEDIQVINATLVKLEFDPKHITAGYTDEAYGGLAECFVSKGQGTMYYKLLHSESMDDIRFFLEMVESDIDAPARRFIEKVNHKLQPVYFEKLSKAIDNDNLSEVENCIKKGAVINSINAKGTTPLHIAAKNGSLDIVKFLLKHGAIYCTKNKEGTTPRNFSKHQSICNLLELTEELFEDTKKGNIKVIRKLRSMKPDEIVAVANARDDQGCTLLQVAIINRHKRIASELVEILKNPDKLQSFSSHECNMDQLKKLLDAAKVHIEFSEMYIRFLQSPGSKNPSPWYTLKQGSYLMGNAYTLVKRYKEYMPGAIDDEDIQVINATLVKLEFDPKHITAGYTDEAYGGLAECFVSKGQGTMYYKLLHSESMDDIRFFLEMVESDIDAPARRFIEKVNHKLQPVHFEKLSKAIDNDNLSEVENCIKKGAVINSINAKGTTPLHIAAKNGSLDIVKFLLKHGAIYCTKNKEGTTPRNFSKHQSICNLLELTEELFEDTKKGNIKVIRKLRSMKPDEIVAVANARDDQGCTLLQVAIINRHKRIASELVEILKNPDKLQSFSSHECNMDQLKKLLDAAKVHIEFSEMYIRFLQSPGSKNPSPWYTLKQGSYLMGNAYTLVKRYKEYMPGAIDDEDIQVINATLVKLEFDPKHITAGYTDEAYGGLAECFVSKGQGTMYYKLLHSESMDDIRFFLEMVESDIDAPARRFIEKVNHKLQPVHFEKLSKAIDNDNLSEVENCIKKGAVINSINAKGTTPLHIAAKNGSLDIVKFLLKHGAIYCTKNKEGTTPRNFSKNQSICNLLELTEELFEDTKKGNIKVIRKLRSVKPDEIVAVANARDDQGCTLLQVAIINRHKRIASELVEILKNPDKLQSFSSHECNMDQLKKLLDAAKLHIEFSEMYIRFLQSPGSKNPSPWYTLKQGSYLMGNAYTLVKRYKEYMPGAIDDEDIQVINATLVKLEFDPKHITAGYTDEAYGGLAECFVSKGQGTAYYKLLHSESKDDIRFFLEMVERDIDAPARRFIQKVKQKLQCVSF